MENLKLHGKANMVLDRNKMGDTKDFSDPSKYCPCCDLTYPDKSHRYNLCVRNIELGTLGPGIPLLMDFIRYSTILMAILTFTYFFPTMLMIINAYNKITIGGDQDGLSLFSIGSFIKKGS